MARRFLTHVLKMEGFKKVEMFQDKTKVRCNGNFALPSVLAEFKTPEETKAFIEGVLWAVGYYEGTVAHYTKDFDIE